MFNLDKFISEYVTKRPKSMFQNDIDESHALLQNKIENKSVLVIGGAGSIGSSFIRALLPYKPQTLVVVDYNENSLAELTRDLRSTRNMFVPDDYIPYPMDYNSEVFRKMFIARGGFDIVANFSAHKHVRSEKDVYSVEVLLQNNNINAKKLLNLLAQFPPEEYFCVSTDKASNPVNIMGASKRIMEDEIFSYSDKFPVKTARFANVAFSNGSLPAGFLARMNKLQPLSAPLDVKRYFVSPQEAGQICLLAAMLGKNREIIFPKLETAQMMKFDNIAMDLLHVNGYEVLKCATDEEAVEKSEQLKYGSNLYPVHFSKSNTSGEKQYEEFYTSSEKINLERFHALGVIEGKSIPDLEKLNNFMNDLSQKIEQGNVSKEEIVKLIENYLPNFNHIETGLSLDEKM